MKAPVGWAAFVEAVGAWTKAGESVVLCHGDFDLIHRGHMERLEAARRVGTKLVVSVAGDRLDDPTVLPSELRAANVAALGVADAVGVAPDGAGLEEILREVRPAVVVPALDALDVHAEVAADLMPHAAAVNSRVHTLHPSTFRQRVIDERKRPGASPAEVFLRDFRKRWTADQVIAKLESLAGQRVLVVGDAIIDEYHYCRPYGMPLKSPIIAAESLGSDLFAGGILAVANHVANFCDEVHLVTVLGESDSQEAFIRSRLRPNVTPHLFFRPGAPTIRKCRFVQKFLMRKLFELSSFDVRPLPPMVEAEVLAELNELLPQFDLVTVADFGHGTITSSMVALLCEKARYLAINTQLNSVNYGFHVVTVYPRADYVCIDEEETRLAARDRYGSLESIIPELATQLSCSTMTVTRGHRGSLSWTPTAGLVATPVLGTEVIDTIGAGDAYLAISAPCVAAGFPPDLSAFIGNCVGALAVQIVGNASAVERPALYDFVRSSLR